MTDGRVSELGDNITLAAKTLTLPSPGVPGEGRRHQLPISDKAVRTSFSRVLAGEGGGAG